MWRIIISEKCNPSVNMGIDYALWTSVKEKKSPPVLRFYLWEPSSVSLGYGQKVESLVNVDFCRKNNIPVVQRPTGGSAIFHDRELTYSFCGHKDHHKDFSLPFPSYISICNALKFGIWKTGIKLEIRGYSEGKEPSMTNIPCFYLSSRHDLVINNKKVVGNAQKRDKTSFLQHGSILLEIRKPLWMKIFKAGNDFDKFAGIQDFIEEKVPIEILIKNITSGFEKVFDQKFFLDTLTEEEKKDSRVFASGIFKDLTC